MEMTNGRHYRPSQGGISPLTAEEGFVSPTSYRSSRAPSSNSKKWRSVVPKSRVTVGSVDKSAITKDSGRSGDNAWKLRRGSISEHEAYVRRNNEKRPWVLWAVDMIAAIKVMLFFLVTINSVLVCAATVGLTVFWYYYADDQELFETSAMNWILLGFAVVTPMTVTMQLAFQRRERALLNIARVRSFSYQIYLSHCLWNWDLGCGRKASRMDWLKHADAVFIELVGICDELSRFLSLPSTSLSRHRVTRMGRNEAARTIELAYRLFDSLCTERAMRLTEYGERLKAAGLSSTETSRIRQYERFMGEAIEDLRMIKSYRTPEALRSVARIFTIVLPPLYAPTYARLALDLNNLGMGIAFGITTAIGLTALFEGIQVLEDPFVAFLTLEGIDVHEEFEVLHWHQLVKARKRIFPNAPPYLTNANNMRDDVESESSLDSIAEEEMLEDDSRLDRVDMFEQDLQTQDADSYVDVESGTRSSKKRADIRTSHYARDLEPVRTYGLKRSSSSDFVMGLGQGPIPHGRRSSTRSLDG